jgi:thiamine-monophosphate kinase
LAALGEFGLIARIRARVARRSAGAVLGIGDDAAILSAPQDSRWLATTDMLLEGVHFQRCWESPRALGRKALAVNVSDIAAMGGRPLYALLGLGIPPSGVSLLELEAVVEGLEEEAERWGVTIVGGDTCGSASGLVVSVTLLGTPVGPPILRSGARPGEGLWVTGLLGGSAAGLLALERGFRPDRPWPVDLPRPAWIGVSELAAIRSAIDAHLTPEPRLAAGQALAGYASAMLDLSDGVASDVRHLCMESGIRARVWADRVPIHPGAEVLGRLLGRTPLELALQGGEDYELLFAAGTDPLPALAGLAGLPVSRIGEMQAGAPGAELVHPDGRVGSLSGGFDHFRSD